MFEGSWGVSFENLLGNLIAELFCNLDIHVSVVEQHGEGAMACGSGQLKVGGAFCGGVGAECMAHVMRTALCDVALLEGCGPGFFDVDAAEGCFTGED
jgi:hypothetical protein